MTFSVRMMNLTTGKFFDSDPEQARLARMRRRVVAWSDAVNELEIDGRRLRKVMITLTYKAAGVWEANHIRDFMKAFKRRLGENLFCVAWVAEMQKRGVVHYHIYAIVLRGTRIPKPDEAGLWPYGSTRIETGRSAFYLIAYLKGSGKEKSHQKTGFPKGCRIFSVWFRKDVLRIWVLTKFRWSALPGWLRADLERFGFNLVGLHPKPKEGGGWVLGLPPDRQELLNWPMPFIEFTSPWVLV